MRETVCCKCGAADGFEHLLKCAGLAIPDRTGYPEPTIAFLIELARAAYVINPGVPEPSPGRAEIFLESGPGGREVESEAEISVRARTSTNSDDITQERRETPPGDR